MESHEQSPGTEVDSTEVTVCYLCGKASNAGRVVSGYVANVNTTKKWIAQNVQRTSTTFTDILRVDDFICAECSGSRWSVYRRRRILLGKALGIILPIVGLALSLGLYGSSRDPAVLVLVWLSIAMLEGVFIISAVMAMRQMEPTPGWIENMFGPLLNRRGRTQFFRNYDDMRVVDH